MINDFPAIWLKSGSMTHAANTAVTVAANVTINDSARNWAIKCFRDEPNTLRTPTSRARLADRAVDRFMKLMQANISINIAMAANM